jgi:DNA-binding transcriptional MerR regulator
LPVKIWLFAIVTEFKEGSKPLSLSNARPKPPLTQLGNLFYDRNRKLARFDMGRTDGMMQIGEVAKKTGVSLRTIRYYEELNLISPMSRSRGGFRLYDRDIPSRIRLILSLQELELSLKEIKTLMALKDDDKTRGEVAKTLLSRLKNHCAEAEKKRAIYQSIIRDFDEGMKILNDCQDCTRSHKEPHCGKHKVFEAEDLLPSIIRSLF